MSERRDLAAVLQVTELAPGRWSAANPEHDPEGRDVVFSGQILAQMIMASDAASGGEKSVASVHAIFSRAGRYSAGPVELLVEAMHTGRTWASSTVTAMQGDRLLSRGLVLHHAPEPDLMRHAPVMPDVPGPDECEPRRYGVVFPGAEVRVVDRPDAKSPDGAPAIFVWVRNPGAAPSTVAGQAAIAWSQPGLIIGAAMRPHSDTVRVSDAHRSISTGVIAHTSHFQDTADLADWLLIAHEGSYAGQGRVFGRGAVFGHDGVLVSTFDQDSMARRVEETMDWKRAM